MFFFLLLIVHSIFELSCLIKRTLIFFFFTVHQILLFFNLTHFPSSQFLVDYENLFKKSCNHVLYIC